MGNNQTFDPQSVSSIKAISDQLNLCSSNEVNDEFLLDTIRKAINALKEINKADYEREHAQELHRLIGTITIFCQSEQIVDEIVKLQLHSTFLQFIVYQLEKKELNYYICECIYCTLCNLTLHSLKFAKQTQFHGFYKLTISLLDRLNIDISSTINNDGPFRVYNFLTIFLLNNVKYKETRDSLIQMDFVQYLSQQLYKLNNFKECQSQVKYIMFNITMTLAYLLNDKELDTLTVSNDVVDQLISALNECITNFKTNTRVVLNSKYYIKYVIQTAQTYLHAEIFVRCIRSIAINDRIKQKLYEKNIMQIIEELLVNGNQNEINCCTDLLCTLCFNENVIAYMKNNKNTQQTIKNINESAKDEETRNSCQQILNMLQPIKRISTEQNLKGHIMISYNHKYKNECSIINGEIKKRGHKTWMDVSSAFNDLYSAMAEAIENASIVLVCYSYEYKISNHCRLEAQYAFKLNKPIVAIRLEDNFNPDGWLGLILSSNLYVDFSKDINSVASYNDLFKQIDVLLNMSNLNIQQNQTEKCSSSSLNVTSRQNLLDPIDWKREDVKNWLIANELDSLIGVFPKLNGIALKSLWEMKRKDYTQFTNSIEKEIEKSKVDVDFIEKMSFYQLIDKLFTT